MSENGPTLSSASAPAGDVPAEASRFVTTCSDQIARVLPPLLEEMFRRVDEALHDLADKSETNSLYTTYLDAMRLLRRRRSDIEALFLLELRGTVHGFLSGPSEPPGTARKVPMELMRDDELEESLAVGNLISKAESRHQIHLAAIRGHLARLLGGSALGERNDPLGPDAICNAFRSALSPLEEQGLAVKLVILKLFDKHVMDHLGSVYESLAEQAAHSGAGTGPPPSPADRDEPEVMASAGPEVTKSESQDSFTPDRQGVVPADAVGAAAFENLQRLLGHDAPQSAESTRASVDTGELMAVLNRLQVPAWSVESYETFCEELRRRLVDELHLDEEGAPDRSLGTVDEDTLDLVFLLFEHILHGNDIPDPIKVLVGRLQIPIVKVALIDKSFFDHPDHPARRLLNHLAELALGWSDDDDRAPGSIYGRIEETVNRIILEFERDITLFATLDASVVAFLEAERQAAQAVESAVRRELEGRERHHDVRRSIHAVIAERLRWYDRVPETVSALLYEGWREVLLAAYERGGMAGAEWRRALQTVDHLIWSVQPKVDSSERRELLRTIPELLRTLRDSLATVTFDQRRLARWIRELQTLHMAALRGVGSLAAEAPADTATRPATPSADRRGADDTAVDAAPQPSSRSGPAGVGSVLEDQGLVIGRWVEIRRDDGKRLRVKLAWRGPSSDTYLFVDRQGHKALELTGGDLATMLAQGSTTILATDAPIVDRAMGAVLETLKSR